jgi:hypothetical protein
MTSQLDQLESRLQRLIESSLALFPWENQQYQLAQKLVAAMTSDLGSANPHGWKPPEAFIIFMNPKTAEYWMPHPEWLIGLAYALKSAGEESGIRFNQLPVIELASDPALMEDTFVVRCKQSESVVGKTTAIADEKEDNSKIQSQLPCGAYLIVDESLTYPLHLPVINIGRRVDNHVVLDDARVSRVHCQLRAAQGHYLLFDLNSTGGTFVNGARITQISLQPGDVISCGGVTLIYGQDSLTAGETDSPTDELRSLPKKAMDI